MSTIDQLKNSAGLIKKTRPSYQDIIGFYEQVFKAQELSKSEIVMDPVMIEQSLLDLKKDSDMPLINPSQFTVDTACATNLLITLCDLAGEYAPNLSEDAQRIKAAVENQQFSVNLLFSAILENLDSVLNDISEAIEVPVDHLILFGFNSIAPSITVCAQQLAPYLDTDLPHPHGYCPICGNFPDLAILDEKGKRHLKCSFCSHQWVTKRMGCSFCGNQDPDKQHYFFSNDEKEYRVNVCDDCKNYIKVVDLRQITRFFYPGLEIITTLHLDMKAKEKGYVNHTAL